MPPHRSRFVSAMTVQVPELHLLGVCGGRYMNTERVHAIETAITAVVLDMFPGAAGWVATTTNDASGRGQFYWEDDVDVVTPDGIGGFDLARLSLDGTSATGALYEGFNLHLPVDGRSEPEEYRVAITKEFH